MQTFDTLKQEYENLLEYKAKGAQIRARIQSIEYNEKSNSYFLCKEKQYMAKKTIQQIKLEDGTITKNPKRIQSQITI